MRPRMIFKLGVTVVIAVAVIIVYVRHNDPDKELEGQQKGEGEGHVRAEDPAKAVIQKKTVNQLRGESYDLKTEGQQHREGNLKVVNLRSGEFQTPGKTDNKVEVQNHQKEQVVYKTKKNKEEKLDISNKEEDSKSHREQNENIPQKINPKTSESEIGEEDEEEHDDKDKKEKDKGVQAVFSSTAVPPRDAVHLSIVACGDRKDESLVLLKSAILFAKKHLVFHIFAETELQKSFRDKLEFWPEKFLSRLDYFIYNVTFPAGDDTDQWKKLFKPCASQRLFLPVLLTQVDSLIYVDTDILFLRPLEDLWSFFHRFNSTQLAALAPEHEDGAAGWYNRFARHPYYGKLGLNSGVMLMNLTRLRESVWLVSMLDYYKEYKLKIAWGDQDLINIYFHYYPEQVYVYGCDWNYRSDHCMYMSVCKVAETEGVSILHGSRRVMHNDKQPAFKAVYDAFKEHRLGDDIQYKLLIQMERNLKDTEATRCGKMGYIFTKQIQIFSQKMREAEREAKNKIPPHPPS